jgi:dipeptidyl aminopeptidase/acylaminoacyl peptidase
MLTALLLAATLHVPTPSEILAYPNLFLSEISPDGKKVAYVMRTSDPAANRMRYEVWQVPAGGGEAVRVGEGNNPQWSRDGKLAYLFGQQVYVDGRQVTNAPDGIRLMQWSPDGASIAYASTVTPKRAPRTYHIVGEGSGAVTRLFVQRLGGEPAAVVDAPVNSFAWSPDGTRIAYGAGDLYVVTLADKSVTKIAERGYAPVWSPDGKRLAYVRQPAQYALNPRLVIGDREMDFDEDPAPVVWRGDALLFQGRAGTEEHLFRADTATGRVTRVTPPGFWSDFSFANDGTVALMVARSGALPEVAVTPLANFAPRLLTHASDALRDTLVSTREVIEWTASDGMRIEGVLVKPPGFDAGKRHPLLVVIHTGPTLVSQPVHGTELPYPIEIFAARGALVLMPNYRGSAGYGERFRRSLAGHLGAPEVDDVMSGIDLLIARGIADPKRVGAMGWSHGGYIAAMLATTKSERFAAFSIGAGVSDWQTFYTLSDAGAAWAADFHGGTPWDVPEAFRATAPLTYVKQAKTPVLIQHGERDPRAPIAGSYELRRALEDQHVPVTMIVYDGAGHAAGAFTLQQYEDVLRHNVEWFGCRIWGDATTLEGAPCDRPR